MHIKDHVILVAARNAHSSDVKRQESDISDTMIQSGLRPSIWKRPQFFWHD